MPHVVALLCGLSILMGQYFYGGIFRPAFMFPSYLLLALAAIIGMVYLFFREQDAPRGLCVGAMGALVGWVVLRISVAKYLPQSEEYLQLFLGCFLIYLLLAYVVVQTDARILFLLIILGGALAQAVLAGGQFFGVWGGQLQGWMSEQLRVWYDRGDSPNVYRRAHGLYINGNHLVWLLNAAGFVALSMGAFGRGRVVTKILWIYVGVVCLGISLACLSRGGLLALGGGMVFIFILSAIAVSFAAPGRRVASYGALIGAFVIPASIVLFIVSQNVTIQARATVLFEEGYRPQVWATALREFQLFPWIGGGPGAFTYYAREFRLWNVGNDDYFAHNDWLQLAADYGFPALALGIVVIIVHLSAGCRSYVKLLRGRVSTLIPQSNGAAVALGATTATVAFSVHSFFDFNLQLPANALLAASCLGLMTQSGRGRSREPKFGEVAGFHRYVGPALLLATTGGLLVSIWMNRHEFQRIKAENFMLSGEFDLASQIAEEAQLAKPDSFALLYVGGVSRQRLATMTKDRARARQEMIASSDLLRKAIKIAPREKGAISEYVRSLLIEGQVRDAKAFAFQLIQAEPRQGAGYELYGSILEAEGDPTAARRVYLLGALMNNTPFIHHRLEVLGKNVEGNP